MSPFASSLVKSGGPLYLSVGLLTVVAGVAARSENTRNHAVHADSLATVTATTVLDTVKATREDVRIVLVAMCHKDHDPQVCDRIGK